MRELTQHIYRQKVNQVLDYISAHLHQPLELDILADKVHFSQRQMLRMMELHLKEPLKTYVTRQRMERAVMYMQTEDISLMELANQVGYDNPQSFSKAFKKQFGISPKAYLKQLQLKLEGCVKSSGNRMNDIPSEICEEEELELVYIRIFGGYGEEDPYRLAWSKLIGFLKSNDALSAETRFIGISFDDPHVTASQKCRFYACAAVRKKVAPTGEFGTIQIRKGKYAVYTLKGSYSGLQELYDHISVNFPYTLRQGVAFEEYLNIPQAVKEEELLTRIYIPVR